MSNILHSYNYGVGVMPAGLFAGALSFLTGPYGQLASTALSAVAASKRAKSGGTNLMKLRNEANRAGFNPLTVLRATGGQGFNNTAGLSSAAFMDAFSGLGARMANQQQAKASLENTIASTKYTGLLAKNELDQKDPYANFGRFIPVKLGLETKELDVTVARRLDILPGDTVSPGDLEEILGELHGNLASAVALEIQNKVIKGGVPGAYGGIGSVPNMDTLNVPTLQATGKSKINIDITPGGRFDKAMKWAFPMLQQN